MQFARVEWLACVGRIDVAAELLAAVPAQHIDPHPVLRLHRARLQAELAQHRQQWSLAGAWWRAVIAMSAAESGMDSAATARWRVPLADALIHAGENEQACAQLARARAALRRELAPQASIFRRLDLLQERVPHGCHASLG